MHMCQQNLQSLQTRETYSLQRYNIAYIVFVDGGGDGAYTITIVNTSRKTDINIVRPANLLTP